MVARMLLAESFDCRVWTIRLSFDFLLLIVHWRLPISLNFPLVLIIVLKLNFNLLIWNRVVSACNAIASQVLLATFVIQTTHALIMCYLLLSTVNLFLICIFFIGHLFRELFLVLLFKPGCLEDTFTFFLVGAHNLSIQLKVKHRLSLFKWVMLLDYLWWWLLLVLASVVDVFRFTSIWSARRLDVCNIDHIEMPLRRIVWVHHSERFNWLDLPKFALNTFLLVNQVLEFVFEIGFLAPESVGILPELVNSVRAEVCMWGRQLDRFFAARILRWSLEHFLNLYV